MLQTARCFFLHVITTSIFAQADTENHAEIDTEAVKTDNKNVAAVLEKGDENKSMYVRIPMVDIDREGGKKVEAGKNKSENLTMAAKTKGKSEVISP